MAVAAREFSKSGLNNRSIIMSKPSIGFIGLGLMGSAMCRRLRNCDYPLTVIANRSRANIDAVIANGATEAFSARELAKKSDIVMLCLDTSASVESRMYGSEGVISGLKNGATVIDFGTSLPSSTRAIGNAVAKIGGTYLDAPLGRTPAHAEEGKLNIMCSGDEAAFKKVKPVLEDLGENVFHLGKLGSGHTVKLINNFFAMTTANSMCEAFALADKTGIERQKLYDVMSAGPLHSGMMDFMKAYAIDGIPDQLAFSVGNARKDIGYYMNMAEVAGVKSIMAVGADDALGRAVDHGNSGEMVAQMTDFFCEMFSGEEDAPKDD
ncbi:MAG: NAD(P)-dependent oxidoreductase [Rhizobiaceae bacterium]